MSELKGVYGVFRHPDDLIHAAKKTTERDYKSWDCFTPYPVHGLDPAMGLSRSWLPWVTLALHCCLASLYACCCCCCCCLRGHQAFLLLRHHRSAAASRRTYTAGVLW